MASFDFSLLDNIHISDDENDTHPNIDTPSLYRMRHRHRLETKEHRKAMMQQTEYDIEEIKSKIDSGNLTDSEFRKIMDQLKEAEDKLADLKLQEKNEGLDIHNFEKSEETSAAVFHDTAENDMYYDKHEPVSDIPLKHIMEKVKESKEGDLGQNDNKEAMEPQIASKSEEDMMNEMKKFAKENKDLINKFFTFKAPEKLKLFLLENLHLVCDHMQSHCFLKIIDYKTKGKDKHVNFMVYPICHLKLILDIRRIFHHSKGESINKYFEKFEKNIPEVIEAFQSEIKNMLDNVSTLAAKRIEKLREETMKEVESMLMAEGQIDPSQVMNILPDELAECFLKRDVEMLKNVLTSMDPEDAEKYMKLCVKCGLWVENAQNDNAIEDNNKDEEIEP